ncbi:MAG: histidine phosphatase family protein [Acidimicrobiales bacterium]
MLILVRHGESTANAAGLLLGRTDAALTEAGRAQATAVGALLAGPVVSLRTSPLERARSTAALLGLGVAPAVDDRWIEVDYGEFECQRLADVPAEVWQRWREDPGFRPAGGETLAEVDARVGAACEALFTTRGEGARSPDGDVVVVSHVTPIKAAVAWALGAGPGLAWRLHLQTASLTRIAWGNGTPVLESFNELAPDREARSQSRRD